MVYRRKPYRKRGKPKRNYKKRTSTIARVVKSVLNRSAETYFIDTNLGTIIPTTSITYLPPTNPSGPTGPQIKVLNVPDAQGSSLDERRGREVMFTHLSAKLRVGKQDFGNVRSQGTLVAHVMFLKNANFMDSLESSPGNWILNPDMNGQLSPLSYFSQSNYGNWISVAKIKCSLKDFIPVAPIPMGLGSTTGTFTAGDGTITFPNPNAQTNNELSRQPNLQYKYYTLNKRLRITAEWATLNNNIPTDTTDQTKMIPFIFVYTDMQSQNFPLGNDMPIGRSDDRIFLQGSVRLSYKDF